MADVTSQIGGISFQGNVNSSSTENFSDLESLISDSDLQARNEALKQQRLAEAKENSTANGSNEQVPPESKASTKEITKGGRNMFRATKTHSTFKTTKDNKSNEILAYDFYRNGYLETYIKEATYADGQQETGQRYMPMPERVSSIGDDWKGALASIKLIDSTKTAKMNPMSQNEGQLIPQYTKFFLESIVENQQEKMQVVETFNDFYVFFYGERPPIYTFSGHLLNLQNYNWLNEFTYYYENFWRGTKAVELGAKVFLTYNYQQVQGYIISMNTNINAATDKAAPFSFQFLVTKRLIFNQGINSGLFTDNLLPKPKTAGDGLDTEAASFPNALTKDFLEGVAPASSVEPDILKAQVAAANKKIVDEKKRRREERNARIAQENAKREAQERADSVAHDILSTPFGGGMSVPNEQAKAMIRATS